MKILITGNQGYVGSLLSIYLREKYPDYYLAGLDTGYFSSCRTEFNILPESYYQSLTVGDTLNNNDINPLVYSRN